MTQTQNLDPDHLHNDAAVTSTLPQCLSWSVPILPNISKGQYINIGLHIEGQQLCTGLKKNESYFPHQKSRPDAENNSVRNKVYVLGSFLCFSVVTIFTFLWLWSLEKNSQWKGTKIAKNNKNKLEKDKNDSQLTKKGVGKEKR